MKKGQRQKVRLWAGVIALGVLLSLVLGGLYARKNADRRADARFFDGVAFAFSLGKNAEPTPTPQPAKEVDQRQEIENYIREVFGDDGDLFVRIARCENRGLEPEKEGPTNDWGIFQVHYPSHKVPVKFLKNWRVNVLIAKQLFEESGLSPWQNSRKCWNK